MAGIDVGNIDWPPRKAAVMLALQKLKGEDGDGQVTKPEITEFVTSYGFSQYKVHHYCIELVKEGYCEEGYCVSNNGGG